MSTEADPTPTQAVAEPSVVIPDTSNLNPMEAYQREMESVLGQTVGAPVIRGDEDNGPPPDPDAPPVVDPDADPVPAVPEPQKPAVADPAVAPPAVDPNAPVVDPAVPAEPAVDPTLPAGSKPPQFRMRPRRDPATGEFDPVETRAFALRAASPEMSMSDALALAARDLGIAPTQSAAPSTVAPTQEPPADAEIPADMPQTLADLEAATRETRQHLLTATKALNPDKQAELQERLFALEDLKPKLQNRAEAKRNTLVTAYQSSAQQTAAYYPQSVVAGSEFHTRMGEIDAAFLESGDSRYNDPNKPLMIAQMVARELNIAPAKKQAQAASPPVSVPQPPKPAAPEALAVAPVLGGGQRSITQSADQSVEQVLAGLDTPEAIENFQRELRGGRSLTH